MFFVYRRLLLSLLVLTQAHLVLAQTKTEQHQEEPIFMMLPKKDPKLLASVEAAKRSLPEFRKLLRTSVSGKDFPIIKTYFANGERGIWLWLSVQETKEDGFSAEPFEVPRELPALKVGSRLWIPNHEVADWMLNKAGVIYGGYSLRLQRERTPEAERASFDSYVGARSYAPLPR